MNCTKVRFTLFVKLYPCVSTLLHNNHFVVMQLKQSFLFGFSMNLKKVRDLSLDQKRKLVPLWNAQVYAMLLIHIPLTTMICLYINKQGAYTGFLKRVSCQEFHRILFFAPRTKRLPSPFSPPPLIGLTVNILHTHTSKCNGY